MPLLFTQNKLFRLFVIIKQYKKKPTFWCTGLSMNSIVVQQLPNNISSFLLHQADLWFSSVFFHKTIMIILDPTF